MQRTVIGTLVGVRTVNTLLLGLAMGAGLALADHSDTPLGESEIVSKRFDGPLTSRALNGNSQLEDLSADGRYVAFNTEGSVTSATRSEPKSLVYDRLTEWLFALPYIRSIQNFTHQFAKSSRPSAVENGFVTALEAMAVDTAFR